MIKNYTLTLILRAQEGVSVQLVLLLRLVREIPNKLFYQTKKSPRVRIVSISEEDEASGLV